MLCSEQGDKKGKRRFVDRLHPVQKGRELLPSCPIDRGDLRWSGSCRNTLLAGLNLHASPGVLQHHFAFNHFDQRLFVVGVELDGIAGATGCGNRVWCADQSLTALPECLRDAREETAIAQEES